MADKVKLGIIGYGHIGSQHGRAIRDGKCPQVDLTAVCDIDPARLELAKKTNGEDIQTFTDASELIHSGVCQAVIIAVPHYLHPSMAIEAMETGTNPLYKKVKDLIDSGDLGEMTRVIWIVTDWYRSQSYYDQGGWRATWDGEGGGVLLNQNPHNLDLWQWMCGIPKRVKSQVYYGKHRNIEVEDDLYALVEYENGATGCYITTVGDAPGTNRLEIDGTNGKIVVENNELTFYRLRIPEPEFNATYKGGLGKPEVWECKIPIKGTYTSHPGIINNFCDCILKGAKPIAPGAEGIRGLQISNAIHLSSWLNGEWVNIPVDGELFLEKLQEHCKEPVTK